MFMSLEVKAITFPQGKLGRFGRQKKINSPEFGSRMAIVPTRQTDTTCLSSSLKK